jgi:hypothetical protein
MYTLQKRTNEKNVKYWAGLLRATTAVLEVLSELLQPIRAVLI